MMNPLYAHSSPEKHQKSWHPLDVHLKEVSSLSGRFAEIFGATSFAELAGLLHDVGKSSPAFQKRLSGSSEHVDHSSAAGQLARDKYGRALGKMLAYLVCGHHGELPDESVIRHSSSCLKIPGRFS